MRSLVLWLLTILLLQYVVLSNGSAIAKSAKQNTTLSNGGKKLTKLGRRMAKLKLIRATMPVLSEAPHLSKQEIAKIQAEENKTFFGGPVSGKISQSKNAGKVAIGARIIKGQAARRGEFPWQVGIIVNDENFCGGSLISHHHVLTAAHCVYNQDSFELVFGAEDRSSDETGAVTMTSKNAVYHAKYNENTLKNDIAIIHLPKAIAETKYIRMIRLPKRIQANRFMKKGVTAQVAGWGRTTDGSMDISDTLKTIKLNMLTSVDCIKSFGKSSFGNTNLCALGKGGDATCQGDSGGALVYRDAVDNTYTQIGLVSYGAAEGCETGYPEVFTKVATYLGWISAQTGLKV